MTETLQIPWWNCYTLSIKEAAAYFKIGEHTLRQLVNDDKDANYILWNGNRARIKRKLFEDVLNKMNVI